MVRGNSYSYDEYLALEKYSGIKHEYVAGEIYAMAGGTPAHARLAAAVIALPRPQLRRGCSVYTSDLRIHIVETDLATYPDVSVICGPPEHATDPEAVVNPVVVVEVTSKSTEHYDRGVKLAHYQLLPSLQEILFVSHRERWLTVCRRDGDGWTDAGFRAGDTVDLRSISARLVVNDVSEDGFDAQR